MLVKYLMMLGIRLIVLTGYSPSLPVRRLRPLEEGILKILNNQKRNHLHLIKANIGEAGTGAPLVTKKFFRSFPMDSIASMGQILKPTCLILPSVSLYTKTLSIYTKPSLNSKLITDHKRNRNAFKARTSSCCA